MSSPARLITAEELLDSPDPRHRELVRSVPRVWEPPGGVHGRLALKLGRTSHCALLACLAALPSCRSEAPPNAGLALTDAAIVDLETGELRTGQTVFLAGNRIVRILPTAEALPADSTRVVDATGGYLVPGLWDAHVHSAAFPQRHFPLLVAHGVTSVRNMHTTVDTALELTNAIKRRVASGELVGPRFLANGPIIDGYPASWPGAVAARTAAQGRALVDSLAAGGADFVKVYDKLTPDAYHGITEQAAKVGIPVDGHVPMLVSPEDAAAAGQRTVEHTSGITLGCSAAADSLRAEFRGLLARAPELEFPEGAVAFFRLVRAAGETRDWELCGRTARAYADAGVTVVPTLVALRPGLASSLLSDSARLALLPAAVREAWQSMAAGPDPFSDRPSGGEWTAPANTKLLHEAGVRVLAGTDLGNPFLVPGLSLHDELRLLVEQADFSPLEALRAATIDPAVTFGLADSLGIVAEGRLADLVLLEANPLEDIAATTAIRAVVLNGRYLDRAALDELLRQAAAAE